MQQEENIKFEEEKDLSKTYFSRLHNVNNDVVQKLHGQGIYSAAEALSHLATPQLRKQFEGKLNLTEAQLLDVVHRADFLRMHRCGDEYSDLLVHTGVKGLRDLQNRDPDKLYNQLANAARKSGIHKAPLREEVGEWVLEAAKYPLKVIDNPNVVGQSIS